MGPVPYGEDFLLGVVRRRRPAEADAATLTAAGRAAFAAYLAKRRATAEIEWNWL